MWRYFGCLLCGSLYSLQSIFWNSLKLMPWTGSEWWDLCAGPHVETTGKINKKAVELESVAGAYWRGDESRQMLQRIYGTAWETEEQLKAYIKFKEEAKRRDHRRLGQDLDLFSIQVSYLCDSCMSSQYERHRMFLVLILPMSTIVHPIIYFCKLQYTKAGMCPTIIKFRTLL